jgi:biopolymer transport protein ExbD
MRRAIVAAVVVACGVACDIDRGPGPQGKRIDPTTVQSHLLKELPPGVDRLDVPVGDVAIYLGNRVEPRRVAPGGTATITHYWKVLKPPPPGYVVFAFVRGAPNTADFMNLLATEMQLAHGPATWESGEIIEDVQTFTVRPDWKSKEAVVQVGLIERGAHGTLGRMPAFGPHVRDYAIAARTLEIDLARAPAPKGTVHITHAQGPIVVDGVGTEPGWASAAQSDLMTAEGGIDPVGKATAKLAWDEEHLYVFVTITDSDIVSPFTRHDEPLWKGDCVELFIDADSNHRGYVELQANPLGVTFDSWFATTRTAKGGGDEAWDSGMVAVAKLRGGVEAGDSGDLGWDVELAIPWAAVKGRDEAMAVRVPPRVGDRWRLNLVRVDRKTGGKPNDVAAASWNRITTADFHALDRMLVAVFADRSGYIVPQAAPPERDEAPVDDPAVELFGGALEPPSIVVEVDPALSGDALRSRVDAAVQRDASAIIVVRPVPTTPFDRLVATVTAARAAGAVRIALPDLRATVATEGAEAALTVDVPAAGAVLDEATVRAALARAPQLRVTVRADRAIPYRRVAAALTRLRQLGVARLAVAPKS